MAHWSASRPTLFTDSSRCRTQRRDWYSVSVDRITSRMQSSPCTGCECLKGLFSRSPHRLIGLSKSKAMPRNIYGSSHRSPTSRLDKDCGLLNPTILVPAVRLPILDVAPSLSPVHTALAHGTTYTGRHHLSTISAHLQKTCHPDILL